MLMIGSPSEQNVVTFQHISIDHFCFGGRNANVSKVHTLWLIESNKRSIRVDTLELFCSLESGRGAREAAQLPRMRMPPQSVLMLLPGKGSWCGRRVCVNTSGDSWVESAMAGVCWVSADRDGGAGAGAGRRAQSRPAAVPPRATWVCCQPRGATDTGKDSTLSPSISSSCSYSAPLWCHAGHAGRAQLSSADWAASNRGSKKTSTICPLHFMGLTDPDLCCSHVSSRFGGDQSLRQ